MGVIDGSGHAGSPAGERLHHHHVARHVHLFDQLRHHPLQPLLLGKQVAAICGFQQAHVHDVAGDGSLGAFVAGPLKLHGKIALRLDRALADNRANRIVTLLPLLHDPTCTLPPAKDRPRIP